MLNPKPKPVREKEPEEEKKTETPSPPAETETPEPDEVKEQEVKSVKKNEANMNYNGGCMNAATRATIKPITCNDTFASLQADFEEDFAIMKGEHFPNLKHIFLKCPENCVTEAPVIGLLVHPKDAVICTSAIADRALDHAGGVISVSLTKAQLA